MEPSQRLTDYGVDKLSKLEKYLDSVLDADITFTIEKFRHRAVVVLSSDGLKIKAEHESEDMYSSMDMVVDKLEKQIKRHREKAKDHLKSGSLKNGPREGDLFQEDGSGDGNWEDAASGGAHKGPHRKLDLPLATMNAERALDEFGRGALPYYLYIDEDDGALRLLRYAGGGLVELVTFHRQAD
jgi:ribosomal subunit interface protein